MFAVCPHHSIIRVRGMRKTCPECRQPIRRATLAELSMIGELAMDRMRAARCLLESRQCHNDAALKFAAFMAIIHGKTMNRAEAERMLR